NQMHLLVVLRKDLPKYHIHYFFPISFGRLNMESHVGLELEYYALMHNQFLLHDSKDRKSTRLNSSHVSISYAVFCLKKKMRYFSRPQRVGFVRSSSVAGALSAWPAARDAWAR